MPHDTPQLDAFREFVKQGYNLIPMYRRLMSDQLTPVLVYRRMVRPDDRMAPSFLLESVEGGERIGRYSFIGSQPAMQIIAWREQTQLYDYRNPERSRQFDSTNPLKEVEQVTSAWKLAPVPGLPDFTGGWVGFTGYDAVRYLEGEQLPSPPNDDRQLPDVQMGLYRRVVAFDHAQKSVLVITHVLMDEHVDADDPAGSAYASGQNELDQMMRTVETRPRVVPPGGPELAPGVLDLDSPAPPALRSNMGEGGYQDAVRKCKDYIAAGDVFQVVPSQRFSVETGADPFDIYRALRIVNPSPYMFYLQVEGGMLVGSSPEILCRVQDRVVTNRPLAGTRKRGVDDDEDLALETELREDPKERAEHIMLVDLGRNDLGRVCEPGTIELPQVLDVERYSHVMHLSSTVVGRLRDDCSCWDALRMTLPVGTVSGAPKVRAMQIIDELEPTRRGPYAGAVGYADFAGNMDMAIALRTMVVVPGETEGRWAVHLQAGAGIVADSDPDAEHEETVNKAAALAKSVDLAERAFERRR